MYQHELSQCNCVCLFFFNLHLHPGGHVNKMTELDLFLHFCEKIAFCGLAEKCIFAVLMKICVFTVFSG